MDLGIYLQTWIRGRLVGTDAFGNRYYEDKWGGLKKRRWVLYHGKADSTKVPADWHGWLHYMFEELPGPYTPHAWQKGAMPNLTGTALAHAPEKSNPLYPLKKERKKQHYQPWDPLA